MSTPLRPPTAHSMTRYRRLSMTVSIVTSPWRVWGPRPRSTHICVWERAILGGRRRVCDTEKETSKINLQTDMWQVAMQGCPVDHKKYLAAADAQTRHWHFCDCSVLVRCCSF